MVRLIIGLVVLACMSAWSGWQDLRVSHGAPSAPVEVELAEIERGASPPANWLAVGRHFRAYWGAVFQYQQTPGAEMKDSDLVDYAYYPILSLEHPYVLSLIALEERYGTLQDAPDEELPELGSAAVLVRTDQFKTIGAIPDGFEVKDRIAGLLVSEIRSLDDEEQQLLKETFPSLDLSDVVILEHGRRPASAAGAYARIGFGVLALGGVAVLGLRSLRGGRPDPPASPPDEAGSQAADAAKPEPLFK